jgi:hypothetical protein
MCSSIKGARILQTEREVHRLIGEVKLWFDKRVEADTDPDTGIYRAQYDSQLKAIFGEINGAASIISQNLMTETTSAGTIEDVYAKCAGADFQIVWLWRVFNFFREKFDQRDDPSLKKALAAADEVIWSCYRPFFQNSKTSTLREPQPLPFIDAQYSPSARPSYNACVRVLIRLALPL